MASFQRRALKELDETPLRLAHQFFVVMRIHHHRVSSVQRDRLGPLFTRLAYHLLETILGVLKLPFGFFHALSFFCPVWLVYR